jgi:hypothetical protein
MFIPSSVSVEIHAVLRSVCPRSMTYFDRVAYP